MGQIREKSKSIKWIFLKYIPICIILSYVGAYAIGISTNYLQDWYEEKYADTDLFPADVKYAILFDEDGNMHYDMYAKPGFTSDNTIHLIGYQIISDAQVVLIPLWVLFVLMLIYILVIRILYSVAAMILLIALFIAIMKVCESDVTGKHLIGGIASAWFLGAVGFAAAGITNNVTVGYMAAMLYYLANYGMKDKVGRFFLFPMSYLGRFDESGWLILGAAALMAVTLGICRQRAC